MDHPHPIYHPFKSIDSFMVLFLNPLKSRFLNNEEYSVDTYI